MLAVPLLAPDAPADIYKCTAADGGVVYTQIPCPMPKKPAQGADDETAAAADCSEVARFAFSIARLMRAGLTSPEVSNRYGGPDAMSEGAAATIDYVYGFRSDDAVTVEQISSRTESMCEDGSLGELSCATLPAMYTDTIADCGAPGRLAEPSGSGRSSEQTAACKKRYRDAIDEIDAEILRDYRPEQADRYKQRLLALTRQLRRC